MFVSTQQYDQWPQSVSKLQRNNIVHVIIVSDIFQTFQNTTAAMKAADVEAAVDFVFDLLDKLL